MLMLNVNSCKCDWKYLNTVICFFIKVLFDFSRKLNHHLIIKRAGNIIHILTGIILAGFMEARL